VDPAQEDFPTQARDRVPVSGLRVSAGGALVALLPPVPPRIARLLGVCRLRRLCPLKSDPGRLPGSSPLPALTPMPPVLH
jgi:hypothetical protein